MSLAQVKEAVFHQAFIPTRMDEVINYERDHDRAQAGEDLEDRGVFYQTIIGLNKDMSGPKVQPTILEEEGQARQAQGVMDLLAIKRRPMGPPTMASGQVGSRTTTLPGPSSTWNHPAFLLSPCPAPLPCPLPLTDKCLSFPFPPHRTDCSPSLLFASPGPAGSSQLAPLSCTSLSHEACCCTDG